MMERTMAESCGAKRKEMMSGSLRISENEEEEEEEGEAIPSSSSSSNNNRNEMDDERCMYSSSNSSDHQNRRKSQRLETMPTLPQTIQSEQSSLMNHRHIEVYRKASDLISEVSSKSSLLFSSDHNDELKNLFAKDRNLISSLEPLDTNCVAKSCVLGKSLAHVVVEKSERLNSSGVQTCLSLIRKHLLEKCGTRMRMIGGGGAAADEGGGEEEERQGIDFARVSSYIGGCIRMSTLCWKNIPLSERIYSGIISSESSSSSSQEASTTSSSRRIPTSRYQGFSREPLRIIEETLVVEESRELEDTKTLLRAEKMCKQLKQLIEIQKGKPISYWKFILDPREPDGFNNSCQNHFLMTFMVRNNWASFVVDREGQLMVEGKAAVETAATIEGEKRNDENRQAVLTQWSYNIYDQMRSAMGLSSDDTPLFNAEI